MTHSNGKINFGLEEETGEYFAYLAQPGFIGCFASSRLSLEDAYLQLLVIMADKLVQIKALI